MLLLVLADGGWPPLDKSQHASCQRSGIVMPFRHFFTNVRRRIVCLLNAQVIRRIVADILDFPQRFVTRLHQAMTFVMKEMHQIPGQRHRMSTIRTDGNCNSIPAPESVDFRFFFSSRTNDSAHNPNGWRRQKLITHCQHALWWQHQQLSRMGGGCGQKIIGSCCNSISPSGGCGRAASEKKVSFSQNFTDRTEGNNLTD